MNVRPEVMEAPMTRWQRPEGWPDGVDPPVWIKVGPAREGLPFVPLADGRLALSELVMQVRPGDGRTITLEVHIADGEVELRRAMIEPDDDEGGLPYSTFRHYRLRDFVEKGLGQVSWVSTSDVEVSREPPSSTTWAAARKAMRRRNGPELLAQVAELYRKGGGGANGIRTVADALVYDPRHARRLRTQAVEAGLLKEGE